MDALHMAVVAAPPDAGGGFAVEIHVNGVEMTAAGAGLGMDPYAVIVPTNRFVASDEPRRTRVARCGCGEYGCGSTDVVIRRDDGVVRWEWDIEVPMDRDVVFDAQDYRREIERVAADHGWETPGRTAGRLLLASLDPATLPHGLRVDWVGEDRRDPEVFRVCLVAQNGSQSLVDFPWHGRTPEALASEVRRTLPNYLPRRITP